MKTKAIVKKLVHEQKVILALSLPLAALLIVCSAVGLLNPGIYELSTPNWLTQTVVQDGVNLFLITPVFLVSALYSFQGVKLAFLMWGGTLGYLVYTFLIYCFSVHFNALFPLYCMVLGLSTFSLFWFISSQRRAPVITAVKRKSVLMLTGIYFIVISSVFYALWLSEIVGAVLANEVPRSLSDAGLMTNPVQVIDVSVFLPLVFIAGVMAIRAKPFVEILIPVILVFFVLMDITIGVLAIALWQNELGGSPVIALVMGALTVFSLVLLIIFARAAGDQLSN
jgi:hypothetical protein